MGNDVQNIPKEAVNGVEKEGFNSGYSAVATVLQVFIRFIEHGDYPYIVKRTQCKNGYNGFADQTRS